VFTWVLTWRRSV